MNELGIGKETAFALSPSKGLPGAVPSFRLGAGQASTRPSALSRVEGSDRTDDSAGESFASMLGASAEAPPPHPTGPARARARAVPPKLPAHAAGANAGSVSAQEASAARERRTESSDDAADTGGTDDTDDNALHHWLASLMHLPQAPQRTGVPATAPAHAGDAQAGGDAAAANAAASHRHAGGLPAAADAVAAGRPLADRLSADGEAAAGRVTARIDTACDPSGAHAGGPRAAASHASAAHAAEEAPPGPPDLRAAAEDAASTPPPQSEPGAAQAALAAGAAQADERPALLRPMVTEGVAAPIFVLPTTPGTPPPPDSSPVALAMPVPLEDPRFAHALGVQVSMLAREGVQQAALHLNPAEMGPVSVQIVLEGTQARVEFGADMARTRELIEHSLPELAAALREAGLTLSGGGVSQQQAGHGDRQPPGGAAAARRGPGRAEPTHGEPTAPATRRWVRSGGVDLYA